MSAGAVPFSVKETERWVAGNIPSLTPPLQWTALAGGHSNLTYLVTDSNGARAVLRRPPMGKLMPKAHDVGREWKIIAALAPTPVPVPAPLGFCADAEVMGADFYVMGHAAGRALHRAEDTAAYVPIEHRREVGLSLVDALAELHCVDPAAVGLDDLGPKDGYLARQLKRWHASWLASVDATGFDDQRAHDLKAFFDERLPQGGQVRVVHGDYGLHNTIIGPDFRVSAIVDWELATLGDPLADFAYVLNGFAGAGIVLPADAPASPPGFPEREELCDRYAERTGADLAILPFYCALNFWKAAAIGQSVYARYKQAASIPAGVDMTRRRAVIDERLDNAVRVLDAMR